MERGKTHQAIFRPLINGMVSRRPHRTVGVRQVVKEEV